MSSLPKVLIFDDEEKWSRLIERTIRKRYSASTTNNPENWNKQVGSSYWDAVVVDVQILGSEKSGTDLAEQAILDFGIVSPMIIISGVVNLDKIKEKYGNIFSNYISKTYLNRDLLPAIDTAVQNHYRSDNVKKMLIELAKKNKVSEINITKEEIEQFGNPIPYTGDFKGGTVREFIDSFSAWGDKHLTQKFGKVVLAIMHRNITKLK